MDYIIAAVFPVESEAFQAFSELKGEPAGEGYLLSQAALIKKDGKEIKTCETFDTGIDSTDDAAYGSLIGACVGILGGPMGVLLGMGLGGLTGASVDAEDVLHNTSMLEDITAKLDNPSVAILALVREESASKLEQKFTRYGATISRYDAAIVEEEMEAAEEAQRNMARQARAALRAERSEARTKRVEEIRGKIKQDFDGLKKRLERK